MTRPSADQLRARLAKRIFVTVADEIKIEALINIAESLEDIAAGLDRERLRDFRDAEYIATVPQEAQ